MAGWWLRRLRGRTDNRSLFVLAQLEPERFAVVYETYYEAVLSYFARRTLDPETAFDLMAETFAAAFADLMKLRGASEDEGRAWLWAIARHQLYRWRERSEVDRQHRECVGREVSAIFEAGHERIEELAELEARRAEIGQCLKTLPADQQSAVTMRVVEELSYTEIAARLGVHEQVVRARVSRGLRRLGRALELAKELPHEAEEPRTV